MASIASISDLSAPGAVREAVKRRAAHGELILFSFDFCGIGEALSLMLTLRKRSMEHFLPLSDGLQTCDAMQHSALARELEPPPCWYASWPRDHPGWNMWGSGAGCVSAARPSAHCVLEQLWATRYHAAAELLAAGVNLLHVDTDSAFLADPYVLLKAPPLDGANLVILPESPANGGMWYAQNTVEGAGAQWVIAEVARRTLAIISQPTRRKMLPPFDQALLGDVLWTAADGGTPHWGAACEHPVLRATRLCTANVSRGVRGMRWSRRMRVQAPQGVGGGAHSATLRFARLTVPGSARVEVVVTAPPWLFPAGWKAQQLGWYSATRPPAFAVAHLLGVRCRWCESSEDVDHGAKWEWQHLAGFWPAGAYTIAPPLNATAAHTSVPAGQRVGQPSGTAGSALAVASNGTGHMAQSERTEAHCRKKGRARFLYADRPALRLARDSPELRLAEAADDDGASARTLVRRLLLLAALTGRVAVLPSFNCSAPWIRKAAVGRRRPSPPGMAGHDGEYVTDLRVVVTYVDAGLPLHAQRCAPCNVQFACRQHVLSEAQHMASEAMQPAGAAAPPA